MSAPRSACISFNILWWCRIISMEGRVCENDSAILLCSEHATISFRPAKSPGNAAAPPGLSDWTVWAKADAGGGALLELCGEPGESRAALGAGWSCLVSLVLSYVQYSPSVTAVIEILSNQVQIYSSQLNIHANFTGIRYDSPHTRWGSQMTKYSNLFLIPKSIKILIYHNFVA